MSYAPADGIAMTKAFAPAAARNQEAIAGVLGCVLPTRGIVLEVASGTGQHASFFAERLNGLTWQPSDVSTRAIASIDAYRRESGRANLLEAIQLDAAAPTWPCPIANAVLCINMVHIAPWESTTGLFRGAAAALLDAGELLVTYGPYRFHGEHTAPSNVQFDANLRAENPAWGVRDVDDLDDLAQLHGFTRERSVPMPANNWTLVWARTAST